MLHRLEESEEIIRDRRRLQSWQKQIKETENKNIYKEIRQRVNEYILKNNLSRDIIDNFNDFLKDCEGYYLNK